MSGASICLAPSRRANVPVAARSVVPLDIFTAADVIWGTFLVGAHVAPVIVIVHDDDRGHAVAESFRHVLACATA